MSTSQPIALPQNDYPMTIGSYNGSANGSFNPASYTRRFLGSPISWRSGSYSFGGRHYSGSPMKDQIRGSFEQTVGTLEPQVQDALKVFDLQEEMCRNFTCCGIHLTDLHALLEHFEQVHIVVVDLPNANGIPHTRLQVPFEPIAHPITNQEQQQQTQYQHQHQNQQQPTHYPTPVDPDDMELEGVPQAPTSPVSSHSSGVPSPPDTLISTPLSPYANISSTSSLADAYPGGFPYADKQQQHRAVSPYSTNSNSPYTSQPPSPHAPASRPPVSAFDTTTVIRRSGTGNPYPHGASGSSQQARPNLNLNLSQFPPSPGTNSQPPSAGEPFNAYGRYMSDYSVGMPGSGVAGIEGAFDNMAMTVDRDAGMSMSMMASGMGGMEFEMDGINGNANQAVPRENCVTPAMLFSNAGTPESTPGHSRVGSPVPGNSPPRPGKGNESSSGAAPSSSGAVSSKSGKNNTHRTGSVGRPSTTSSLLMSKPFKCPKPNCNKSYKQANGLKYHITHGSCNFAPSKDLEHVQALLDRKRKEKEHSAVAEGAVDSEPPTPSRLSPPSSHSPSATSSAPPSTLHSPSRDGAPALPSPLLPNSAYSPSSSQPASPHPLSQGSSSHHLFPDLSLLPESDLRELEVEAEKRVRPFACTVGDCPRRYKNMNGLRYHYQHSGEHGLKGLSMLASGVHECLQIDKHNHGVRRARSNKGDSRAGSRASTPPLPHSLHQAAVPTSAAILQQGQQQQQQSQLPSQMSYAQAQVHLAYQQQYAEHQRAQYAAQQQAAAAANQQRNVQQQQQSEQQQQQWPPGSMAS